MISVALFYTQNSQAITHVEIDIQDPEYSHVHPADDYFTLRLYARADKSEHSMHYQWINFQGKRLTDPLPLDLNRFIEIQSPANSPGYYGLVILPVDTHIKIMDRRPGEAMEFGFVILPEAGDYSRDRQQSSQFGTVHSDLNDLYLPVWVKTLTWNTLAPDWWGKAIRARQDAGFQELPIIVGEDWESDDRSPISTVQLATLRSRATAYFRAAPEVIFWELGIEENLIERYEQRYYWINLAAKANTVKQAAMSVNPEIKLVYQIANLSLKPVRQFLHSPAASHFDILSLHPYAWPDFVTPEYWLPTYMQQIRDEMRKARRVYPVWFTEVGAPHHGNSPGEFFGYPDRGISAKGLSRTDAVSYMIKLHVVALYEGVEKIFWYNYKDQEAAREEAENHFGLIDIRGFPKPVYVAYLYMHSILNGKLASGHRMIDKTVIHYQFADQSDQIDVLWNTGDGVKKIKISDFAADPRDLIVTNAVGRSLSIENGSITVDSSPVYLSRRRPDHLY